MCNDQYNTIINCILTGKVFYGFAYDVENSNFKVVVMWKSQPHDVFSFVSIFSTFKYEWDRPVVCAYDIDSMFYQRAIHINGRLYCIGSTHEEDDEIMHFIMELNPKDKYITTVDLELIIDGLPELLTVLNNKIGVVYR